MTGLFSLSLSALREIEAVFVVVISIQTVHLRKLHAHKRPKIQFPTLLHKSRPTTTANKKKSPAMSSYIDNSVNIHPYLEKSSTLSSTMLSAESDLAVAASTASEAEDSSKTPVHLGMLWKILDERDRNATHRMMMMADDDEIGIGGKSTGGGASWGNAIR